LVSLPPTLPPPNPESDFSHPLTERGPVGSCQRSAGTHGTLHRGRPDHRRAPSDRGLRTPGHCCAPLAGPAQRRTFCSRCRSRWRISRRTA
jgi:hypothetical protein